MKLKYYRHHIPVLIEGEGGTATNSFIVGGTMSGAPIIDLEATPLGILVTRAPQYSDVLLTEFGWGIPAEKRAQQPAQLKGTK